MVNSGNRKKAGGTGVNGRGSLRMVASYRAAWNTSRGLMELLAREENDDDSALRLCVL